MRLRRKRRQSGPVWPEGRAVLDWPSAGADVPRGPVVLSGWALFPATPTARVELWLGDRPLGRARTGLQRRDVARLSENPLGLASGFELTTNLGNWPEAEREAAVRVVATSADGERVELPPVPVRVSEPRPRKGGSQLPPPPPRTPDAPEIEGPRTLVGTHQLDLGGAQLYLVELLRELLRLGAINPVVVSATDGPVREQLEALGIPVHISNPVPIDELGSYIGHTEDLLAWSEGRDFELALINTSTANALAGAEVAAELGIPAVWLIHESYEPAVLWAYLDERVRRRAEETLAGAAMAIFEAEATRRLYEPLIGADRTMTIPYALDLAPVEAERAGTEPGAARRRLGIDEEADVLLCLGTVEPRKAQVPLAQAFALLADRHPRAELLIVGCRDDDYTLLLEEVVGTLGCGHRIRLVPVTPDVHSWLAVSDILVCASDIESLPRTALEAMAWEKPVLATSVFGLPELIDDGETGWLCEPNDVAALAEGLDRALSTDEPERRRLASAARERLIADHDPDAYARRMAALLAGLRDGERRG